MIRVISLIVIASFILFAGTGVASASIPPPPPQPDYECFYGTVSINGTLAPDGTVVSARAGAFAEANDSTENGRYSVTIEGKHKDTVILRIYNAVVHTTTFNTKDFIWNYLINLSLEDYSVNGSAQPDTLPETTNESLILINWASHPGYDSTGVKCYELLRKYGDEETFSIINKTSDTSYLDNVTAPGKYYYRLVTYDFVGNSKNSTHDVNTSFVSSETYTVSGYVKYENETGISNANITLTPEKDSRIINSTTTAGDGYYELMASWGKYNLIASKGDIWDGTKYISFLDNSTTVNLNENKTENLTVAIKGDLNGDCAVTMEDVKKVASMVIGSVTEDLRADLNGNGYVDVGDAAKLFGYVKGSVDRL